MLEPCINKETLEPCLEVNVRVLEGEKEGEYAIDGVYPYSQVSPEKYLEQIYPDQITRFEETFADAELQYYQPDRL